MRRCLWCAVLVVLVVGCGSQKHIYTTTEKRMEQVATKDVDLAVMFDHKARTFVMDEKAQEHNAPYKPGYNVRGETVPLGDMNAVARNITKEWAEVTAIMERGEPYDYPLLAQLGYRLVMRSEELTSARQREIEKQRQAEGKAKRGGSLDKPPEDETDRAIMRFGVLAKRFMEAAATRNPDDLVEAYTVIPASTPFILSGRAE
jgi:hypothetical protein